MKKLDALAEKYMPVILEIIFIIIGLQLIYTAYSVLKDKSNQKRIGTAMFWGILGVMFIAGPYIPNVVNGVLVLILGALTLFNQVTIGKVNEVSEETQTERGNKYGYKVFIPVVILGVMAFVISKLVPSLSSTVVGISALIALIAMIILVKPKSQEILDETNRMTQQVSTTGILPQLLAAVGTVFTAAGVGDVISGMISGLIPEGSRFWGVVAYVVGMVLFTMVMGNAFAAFAVITVGIGIPFVFSQGADPAIASALAMTAGFCGTLMTPMAGNFNALPAALMDMKSPYSVIIQQIPVALVMIVVHIVLMYYWAF